MGMCTSIPNSSDAGLMPERYQFYQNPCYPVVIIKRQEGVDHDVPKRGFRSHRAIPPSGRQSGVHTAGASPQAAEKTAGPVPLSGHVLRTDDGVWRQWGLGSLGTAGTGRASQPTGSLRRLRNHLSEAFHLKVSLNLSQVKS